MKKQRRTLTQQEAIDRCIARHGNRYDYSKVIYTRSNEPITIICREHGEFSLAYDKHTSKTRNHGCPQCAKYGAPALSQDEFLLRLKDIHGDKYNYDSVVFINTRTKVNIKCEQHGFFEALPTNLLTGQQCPVCSRLKAQLTIEEFVTRAKEIHGNLYDYSGTVWNSSRSNISIVCSKHGAFEQSPFHHLNGSQCPKCVYEQRSLDKTKSNQEYILEAQKVHKNKFTYEHTIYAGKDNKIIVTCSKHGNFEINAGNHLHGLQGCSRCSSSYGENLVETLLKEANVRYERQARFEECKAKSQLPFDFRVFRDDNSFFLIEVDGAQHRRPVRINGVNEVVAKEIHIVTQKNDAIKNKWASDNAIRLYRLPYEGRPSIQNLKSLTVDVLKEEFYG